MLFAFLAGFVDAVAGGGGLIQLPALFVFLPPSLAGNVAAVMGTNKFASICGTSIAAWQYLRKVRVQARAVAPTAIFAFLFSYLGARTVTLLDPALVRPVILILLIGAAVLTYTRKNLGQESRPRLTGDAQMWAAAGLGAGVGFYDGFFGPGTGSFLILGFVLIFGFDFLQASASAKLINLTTNLAAVGWFAWTGNILYEHATGMAAANVAGATLGARLAILKGNAFVRRFFLTVVLVLIAVFGYEMTRAGQ